MAMERKFQLIEQMDLLLILEVSGKQSFDSYYQCINSFNVYLVQPWYGQLENWVVVLFLLHYWMTIVCGQQLILWEIKWLVFNYWPLIITKLPINWCIFMRVFETTHLYDKVSSTWVSWYSISSHWLIYAHFTSKAEFRGKSGLNGKPDLVSTIA